MWDDDRYRRDDDSPEPWRSQDPWVPGDGEGWRGELHRPDEGWRGPTSGADESWRVPPPSPSETEGEWRGEVHLADWPEWDAGPEYRMWKKLSEGE
jgi:hypothetical protein